MHAGGDPESCVRSRREDDSMGLASSSERLLSVGSGQLRKSREPGRRLCPPCPPIFPGRGGGPESKGIFSALRRKKNRSFHKDVYRAPIVVAGSAKFWSMSTDWPRRPTCLLSTNNAFQMDKSHHLTMRCV